MGYVFDIGIRCCFLVIFMVFLGFVEGCREAWEIFGGSVNNAALFLFRAVLIFGLR
ncbi:hypothetical protein [Alkalilimnicola ehrlichii]|uniref:hypothetical protein n=1 Tax=Alkalilimnicola ehrlichii TaxID=351052 RepID=UPI0015F29EE2|nr:hypothetical protein [Alkalilimnicola ehrlichii]